MKIIRVAIVAAFLVLAATSAHAGKMTKTKEPLVTSPDKANIVFMRPGKLVGAAVAVPVFDVTGEGSQFVGLVEPGSKVAYSVPSGEYVFMTTIFGGDANVRFYKANVEAGKTYYFYAHLIGGLWGLEPVRVSQLDGKEFKGWDKGTDLTINSPRTIAWSEENKESIAHKRMLKPEVVREENTLRVEDGR